MKSYAVKESMVPIGEYATVSETATLSESVLALEKAQRAFDQKRYRHRAILVLDQEQQVVGKISQHDVLRALEPNYEKFEDLGRNALSRLGFSKSFVRRTLEEYRLWDQPLDNLCQKALARTVKEIMQTPNEGEFITADATLNEAVHQLIVGRHHSLLVTQDSKIVGVLRLTDVFEMISGVLKAC